MDAHRPPRDAGWLSNGLLGIWALSVCGVIAGGVGAWVGLRIGLCQGADSPDTSMYCSDGGWEASGVGVAAAIGLAVILPVLALSLGRKGLFRLGLVLPVALLGADIAYSLIVGIP
jgi:hypothetical protein